MQTLFITGGSASGKSTLARMVQREVGGATVLAQDSFYRDRPDGSAEDRHAFDFDQPYSIDWEALSGAIATLAAGRPATIPTYDFTVSLRNGSEVVEPDGDLLIVDGTLIMHHRKLCALARHSVYVRASEMLRRARREHRDVDERGRHLDDVRRQLADQVFPAHNEFVLPCADRADLVLDAPGIVTDPAGAVDSVLALIGFAR